MTQQLAMPALASAVDWRAVDWDRASRATYALRLHYRYDYDAPVTDLCQRLVLVPPSVHGDQRVIDADLVVRGADGPVEVEWTIDGFGNRVCSVQAARVEQAIEFEARYQIQRVAGAERLPRLLPPPIDLAAYLRPTALTTPNARIRRAARAIAAATDDPCERAERANAWAAAALVYQIGVTDVQTTAARALALGRGVCQDYAHVLLAVLRLLDVPARYVSGHLLGEGPPHAWVEALIEDSALPGGVDVVAYDPTHCRRARMNYVTVAVGRDFADVTPTSGVYTGRAVGNLSSSKQAIVLEVIEGETDARAEAAM